MDQIICVCEDTVDGIFTAIYKAWEIGTSKTTVEVKGMQTMKLFSEYIEIETDYELAKKVARSIERKISGHAYYYAYRAALSDFPDKAHHIYQFLIKGFKVGKEIINYLQDESVMKVFEMTRRVWFEAHRYLGFVRFSELENGVLSAKINPKSNVIPVIAEHFEDRLHNENWIILDTERKFAAIHRTGYPAVLTEDITEEKLEEFSGLSENEEMFKQLWKRFFDTIAIEERKNARLQQQMMPLRYRKYM